MASRYRSRSVAVCLTRGSVRSPRWVAIFWVCAAGLLAVQAARVAPEVGYAAYFGPDDPNVRHLEEFLGEFESGLHILLAFSCAESTLCQRVSDPAALDLIGRMQAEIDTLPNVRRTLSLLNAPIVVGPLDSRTLASRAWDGSYRLEPGWEELVQRATGESLLVHSVVSRDATTAGLVVELRSLESTGVRDLVHSIQDRAQAYEEELGGEIYLAGDPIWTVVSDDDLNADSRNLTILMFAVIIAVLWGIFRNIGLTLLPVLAVGLLVVAVQGLIGLTSTPMTSILTALPPLLVVIAITTSIHLMTAARRKAGEQPGIVLVGAADEVGAGCFWASFTTMGGFASFLWSDLESFRSFGAMAACGVGLSFVLTFTLLPALCMLAGIDPSRSRRARLPGAFLQGSQNVVTSHPGRVVAVGVIGLGVLGAGIPRLHYEADFGDQSFILRSVHFLEDNLRKPMTTELVLSIPEGTRIYHEEPLRLLSRFEAYFASEPSTGHVWSFLDFLREAQRLDTGHEPASFEALVAGARSAMPIVANYGGSESFWSESVEEDASGRLVYRDRARVSVDRAWLDDDVQEAYLARLRSFLAELNTEIADAGYRVDLEGGLVLSDLALDRIRATQRSSFLSAFVVVAVVLGLLMMGNPSLLVWATLVNVLPVAAVLGLMGWLGIGVDPANSMVAAILLVVAVDDTIHIALCYSRERATGGEPYTSVRRAIATVGEAVLVTSVCLALGFSVLMFSRWGGLVSFGLLASAGVVLALLADVFVLPAAMLLGAKRPARSPGRRAAGPRVRVPG